MQELTADNIKKLEIDLEVCRVIVRRLMKDKEVLMTEISLLNYEITILKNKK